MKSKKPILLLVLIFAFSTTKAQETLECNYKNLHGSYVITPSLFNMMGFIHMPVSQFKATMTKYNYGLTTDRSAYIANTTSPSPYYTINKTNNTLSMIYTTDDGDFVETARQQLRAKTKSVSYDDDGYEVYRLKGTWDGIEFRYVFYLKEEDGAGVVLLKLQ
jgi:hypothetical protein